ncbi:MAG: [FeFe] hydrogenase H-cluster radical SAM maturase HydG [Candidatus Omnitrophica bacterium]|nr:[FeFe] hydrogenase H-cluster radical SAM maturase HydG [Candidatus Omnitrophota bacterium]
MSITHNKKNLEIWIKNRVRHDQVDKYLHDQKDFIDEDKIFTALEAGKSPDAGYVRDILKKSLAIETLNLDETAALLNVTDPDLLAEMRQTAAAVKKKVYDNRIVTFAPLYLSNFCVNNCLYCGFRSDNILARRRTLSIDEVKREIEVLAGTIGHKRLIVVYGEHPQSDIDYMVDTIAAIYEVKVKTKKGVGQIRRVNVNAPPLSVESLRSLKEVGIGTYQVFQETYHHDTYRRLHPQGTIKGDYRWRLYCMHRAFEAGIDDVGIGVLFGLYDWKFEVLGLVTHARILEAHCGVGPHTVSFPRLEEATHIPFTLQSKYRVRDEDFKKIVTVLRLAIPYTGMILTARETASMRRETIGLGVTQIDASTRIGIGAYSDRSEEQEGRRQQFLLGDTRSLDEVIRELARDGYITSFCTAGYRCGRTGECIMELLKTGKEGQFCKLNAILTFREWLDDFASKPTQDIGEEIINKELDEVKKNIPGMYPHLVEYYERVAQGERDLYF